MSEIKHYTLTVPIPPTDGRSEVSVITFRRPKLKDMRRINRIANGGDEIEQSIAMLLGCTDLTEEQADQIDFADMLGLTEALAAQYPTGEATTKNS